MTGPSGGSAPWLGRGGYINRLLWPQQLVDSVEGLIGKVEVDDELRQFLQDDLGLYTGAYIYLTTRDDGRRGLTEGVLPYLPRPVNGVSPSGTWDVFVQNLFVETRKTQWTQDAGEAASQGPYRAEYLAWQPNLLPHDTGPRRWEGLHPDEVDLRNATNTHYVPFGEVVLWCALWRHYLEEALGGGQASEIRMWNSPNADTLADLPIERSTRTLVSGTPGLAYHDAPLAPGWPNALFLLNLLVSKREQVSRGPALGPFLAYASFLISANRWPIDPPKLTETVDLGAADRLWAFVRKIGGCILGPKAGDPRSALVLLHHHARFPIVPYFYWNALALPEVTCGITHLACPVWLSAVTTRKRSSGRPSRLDYAVATGIHYPLAAEPQNQPGTTTLAGIAVVGMRPVTEDWTLRGSGTGLSSIFDVRHVIQSVGRLHIDEYFVDRLEVRGAQLKANRSVIGLLGHAAKAPAMQMLAILEYQDLPVATRIEIATWYARIWHDVLDRLSNIARPAGTVPGVPSLRSALALWAEKRFVQAVATTFLATAISRCRNNSEIDELWALMGSELASFSHKALSVTQVDSLTHDEKPGAEDRADKHVPGLVDAIDFALREVLYNFSKVGLDSLGSPPGRVEVKLEQNRQGLTLTLSPAGNRIPERKPNKGLDSAMSVLEEIGLGLSWDIDPSGFQRWSLDIRPEGGA